MPTPFQPFDFEARRRADTTIQPRERVFDPVSDAVGSMRQDRAQAPILQGGNPDKTATVTRLSRQTGEAPALIEGREEQMQRFANARTFGNDVAKHPAMGVFFGLHPRHAVAAQDDSKALKVAAWSWDTIKKVPGSLKTGALQGGGWVWDAVFALDDALAYALSPVNYAMNAVYDSPIGRAVGLDGLLSADEMEKARVKRNMTLRAGFTANTDAARPKYTDPVQQGLLSGVESIPAMGVAMLTRNPKAGAAVLGGLIGSSGYMDARAAGKQAPDALRYGITQGGAEYFTEVAPASVLLSSLAKRTGVLKTITGYLAAELPGEMSATLIQSASTWATLNPDKPYSEWVAGLPREEAMTVLGVIGGGTITAGGSRVAVSIYDRATKAKQAKANGAAIDQLGNAAVQSKLRARDPEAYNELLRHMGEQSGASHVFVPGEAVREYMQSDSYDPFSDPLEAYRDDIEEAYELGGDVVLPAEFAFGTLPGTPAWEAIKSDMRLAQGGESVREAQDFEAAMSEVSAELESLTAKVGDQDARIADMAQAVQEKLQNAGFTPYVARQHATVIVQRIVTRAARLGQGVTGGEFDTTEVRQVLPPELAKARKADATDLVINALRRGRGSTINEGPSLIEWISKNGGIWDGDPNSDFKGGDFKAMGLADWHKGKRGRKKAIRDPKLGAGNRGADVVLVDAIEAGYFPELNGYDTAADASILQDAINAELAGSPRYAESAKVDNFRLAAEELDQLLTERGIDPEGLSDDELRAVVAQLDEARADGGFEQAPVDDAAFEAWAGVSREEVIDPEDINDFDFSGSGPFVLRAFHGTTHEFEAFDASLRGNKEGQFGAVNYFTSSESDAEANYAGEGPDLTQRIEQRAEQIEQEADGEIDMAEARKLARAELAGGTQQTLEVYIRTDKPFIVGSEDSPWIEFTDFEALDRKVLERVAEDEGTTVEEIEANRDDYEDQIDEARWDIESEEPDALFEAVQKVAARYDLDAQEIYGQISDAGMISEGARQSQLEDILRKSEGLAYAEDPKTGGLIGYHVLGDIIRELGFDSIILKNASDRFKSMDMEQGTAHIQVFDEHRTNIKSINNRGTFDPADPRILFQAAYHGSPHIFDKFSLDAIGTGEGAQAYGWGLYFAGRKEIAEHYRKALSGRGNVLFDGINLLDLLEKSPDELREIAKTVELDFYEYDGVTREQQGQANKSFGWAAFARALDQARAQRAGFPDLAQTFNYIAARYEKEANQQTGLRDRLSDLLVSAYARALGQSDRLKIEDPGRLYQVEIPDDDEYLLWDKPLSEQPEKVRVAISAAIMQAGTSEQELAEIMFDDGDVNKVTGKRAYEKLVEIVPAERSKLEPAIGDTAWSRSDEIVSTLLHNAGIAGIKYLDGGSRTAGEGSFNYVVFDENRVSIQAYEQAYSDGPRGRIQFMPDGRSVIELFQGRNLSTLIHELGHDYLEQLRVDSVVTEQLGADWAKVEAWFADNGHAIENGVIPTEAHEMWARGFERYVMEGKAPSEGLRGVFETFRGWLVSIYKTVTGLRAPITPEIREVMDRLLATDEEIASMRDQQMLEPLFKDAAAIGMSDQEFLAYQAESAVARDDARSALLDKTMAAIRRRETAKYRTDRVGVEQEIAEEVDAQPLFRALRNLKAMPVSKEWLEREMGADVFSVLPVRVPPIYKVKGEHPDSVAELSGYQSGRQMIEALIGAQMAHKQMTEQGDKRGMRDRVIQTETDLEMNRRYGDPLNDGTIEREALEAVHNEKQGEVFAAEARALARKTGQRPTPYRIARNWARGKVRQGVYQVEASPGAIQRHQRNVTKAGRQAEQAYLAGKFDEALRAKQQQMVSSALLAEAKAAHDEVEAARKRLDKIARRVTSKSVDQEYLDQAHALLEAVDLRPRSQKSIERQGKWEAWSADREAEGFDIVVPASFEATLGTTNWSRLPVETLLALDDAVAQVMHLGRLKQSLLDGKERREFDAVVQEAVDGAGGLKGNLPKGMDEGGIWDAIKGGFASVDASLIKMETVFDWLDGGNANGVFNRIVFRPVADAQAREQDMMADYFGQIKALFASVPGDQVSRWGDKVATPFTEEATGRPWAPTRQRLIAAALNIGNEGNLQRLADGYGYDAGALEAFLIETLTAQEWQMVQGVWDTIETLWPEIEALEKRVNGVAPDKVEAREIVTPYGTFRGGYYPAVYDTATNYRAEANRGRESDLFEGGYTRATTRSSATKERAAKVNAPILLDLGVINRHLGEVIHDITHREAVMQANKFLTSERVMRAVDQALGPDIRKQFRPWVKFVANSWAMERAGNEGIGKWLGMLRANVTAVGMGLRATTMVTQIAGYSNSVEVVGEKWIAEAVARTTARPVESFNFVLEKSPEVRHRMDNLDRDIRTELARLSSKGPISKGLRTALEGRKFFFHGIGYMDRMVSVPTWLGAYNKALASGADEQEAIYAGDKAVRVSQGSGAPKDMAAIARGTGKWGEALKLMTMFYTYFSAMYQRERTLYRDVTGEDVRRPRDLPRLMARAWWLIVVPPLLTEVLKAGLGGGQPPEDDEWWAQWILRKMVSNAIGPIPLARDMFEPAWNAARGGQAFNPQISPVNRALSTWVNSARDLGDIARGEETTKATKNMLESVGYATGLVPGQVASATQFLVDVGNGDVEPDGFGDWVEGLSTGKLEEE